MDKVFINKSVTKNIKLEQIQNKMNLIAGKKNYFTCRFAG